MTDDQDIKEYLTEREGMRIDNGESESQSVEGARQDLSRLQGVEHVVKPFTLDL